MDGIQRYGGLGAQYNPVVIDDDDNLRDIAIRTRRIDEEAQTGRQLAEWAAAQNDHRAGRNEREDSTQSDELDREERIEDALEQDIAEIIDLTGDDNPVSVFSPRPVPREEPGEVGSCNLPSGLVVEPGMTVEVNEIIEPHGIQFVRVKSIIRPGGGSEIFFRGWGYSRTRHLDGMLPRQLNEVALVAEIRCPDPARLGNQGLVDVTASNVMRVRELRVTNTPFPEHRFDLDEYMSKGRDWVDNHAPLVCRYRYDVHYNGNNAKPCEWELVKIGEREADPSYKMLDEQNLNRWRGGKVPGGSHNPGGFSKPVFDLDSESPTTNIRRSSLSPGQRYTAGDVFAGAGGASRGIERAGVNLVFAVDHWDHAAQSLRANFPNSCIHNMDVTDFITSEDTRCDVDILHLSPPCQFWSPAHTVAGKNDDNNIAVLFSCRGLVEKFRPRIFTVEQTFGILSPKFTEFFNTFIHGFTEFGYSVRWKVLPLANYGVPQLRRRLIMIGSAPGEQLPPFPPPTHSKDGTGGLQPWATPQSVLTTTISPTLTHPLHQPHLSKQYDPPKPPWDPTKLARTITTNGGQNYHWTGARDFTLLEYAVLQGFPTWHRFRGRYVKKQIGNAFAPSVVRVLYEHLVDWLLVQDGFDAGAHRRARLAELLGGGPDLVTLDDDDHHYHHHGNEEEEEGEGEDELVYLGPAGPGSPPPDNRRLSEVVRELNRVAKEEDQGDDVMDWEGLDDLSDTETLRDVMDVVDMDGIDLTMDVEVDLMMDGGENGTAGDPYVLSD
ncbi:S-adenosyl-L-methionine-dependent methyltransferase [Chaetomidium leptoderma]|uniref:DNA (cytosine-5-)-methyltransferase n=1 Tax=Chaetomidium leptoderma TaxID=669021 RepID=A0AAN6ZYT0_9PEZI|nr:S-adenosyl-L-methionine-dependent methyltransferase [Chaetomidium leptoderma]